jgi:hypothetical protein
MGQRLQERTVSLIETHQPEPLPAQVKQEIDRILAA